MIISLNHPVRLGNLTPHYVSLWIYYIVHVYGTVRWTSKRILLLNIIIDLRNINFKSISRPITIIYSNIILYHHPLCRRTVLVSVGFSNIPSQSLESAASNTGSTSHRDNVYISVRSKSFRPNTRLYRSHKINGQVTSAYKI